MAWIPVFLFYLGFGHCLEVFFSLCGYSLGGMVFSALFDFYSGLCLMMLFICSFIVLPFVFHYMGGFSLGLSLYQLILLFTLVMGVLMVTDNFISTLLGWEYLGLVSYLLILFLGTLASIRSSLITLVSSRFGDVALFVVLGLVGSFYDGSACVLFGLGVILIVLTKSACFPFTSWLLEAMRAPTPVSCLVHSSTLVAAGVWFCMRYGGLCSDSVKSVLVLCCLVTIFLTASAGLFFVDLKKLVALSTCNNISWCVLCYCLGDIMLCVMFLITHGVSKCLLFMSVGDLMITSGGSQSALGVYLCRYGGLYSSLAHMVLLSSLCGLPFMGVFVSKHVVACYGSNTGSILIYLLVCLGVIFSFAYTYRFAFLLLSKVSGLSLGVLCGFYLYGFMGLVPIVINYIGSYCMCWSEEGVSLFWGIVSIFFYIHLVGVLVGAYFYHFRFRGSSFWLFILGGCECLVGAFYSFYVFISSFCFFSFYRWEVGFMRYLSAGFDLCVVWAYPLLAINFMVLGILCFAGVFYFFWFC